MKHEIKIPTEAYLGVIVLIAAYYIYQKSKAGITQLVTTDLNPTSDQNIVYKGVNAVGSAVSGNNDFSLGSAIYDLFHTQYDPNATGPQSGNQLATNNNTPGYGLQQGTDAGDLINYSSIFGTGA